MTGAVVLALVFLFGACLVSASCPAAKTEPPPPAPPSSVVRVQLKNLLACRCPCNDNDPCTYDECDPEVGCIYIPVTCDDGDPCTVDPVCNSSYPLGCPQGPRPLVCCSPSSGLTLCSGTCVNLQTDVKNCGVCGRVCGGACVQGLCV